MTIAVTPQNFEPPLNLYHSLQNMFPNNILPRYLKTIRIILKLNWSIYYFNLVYSTNGNLTISSNSTLNANDTISNLSQKKNMAYAKLI